MSAIVFDVIRRYLQYRGYEVEHAMNFTDVDDKIINRANREGVDPFILAERYIAAYNRHMEALNVLPPTISPRATLEMEGIVAMIQGLIDRGFAYPTPGGDVYFRVRRDEDYGRLSGRRVDDMQAGARIEVGEIKADPLDFALWKAAKPGEPAWFSPWGQGRPGWHIECSAMNLSHLGEQIDIHGGGNDLIFPHHENEIAQTESYTGKPFARYWVHNGMLQLGGEKMSKSLGNMVTIDDFLARYPAGAFRYLVLSSSYRSPLAYNDEIVEHAVRALDRLRSGLRPALPGAQGVPEPARLALAAQVEAARAGFEAAMDADFNTAGAFSPLYELVKAINAARAAGAEDEVLRPAQEVLRELTGVLGFQLQAHGESVSGEPVENEAGPFIDLLLEVRAELRRQKLWALSDQIRDRLKELGIAIEDTKEGSSWIRQ
jgi:cysteinyl-tRNA synthetase